MKVLKPTLCIFVCFIIFFSSFNMFINFVSASSNIVDTDSTSIYSVQRKTFYNQGLWWVFYFNDVTIGADPYYPPSYRYITYSWSDDNGTTWTEGNYAVDDFRLGLINFDVWCDNTDNEVGIYYTQKNNFYLGHFSTHYKFIRGTLYSNGTIGWYSSVKIVQDADYDSFVGSVAKHHNNQTWWVAFATYEIGFRIYSSSNDGGTWTNRVAESGGQINGRYVAPVIIPNEDTDDTVYFHYVSYSSDDIHYRYWENGVMSDRVDKDITFDMADNGFRHDKFSGTMDNNGNVHLIWISSVGSLYHIAHFINLGHEIWSNEHLVKSGVSSPAFPTISFTPLDNLHTYWFLSDNKVYHSTSVDYGISWSYPDLCFGEDVYAQPLGLTSAFVFPSGGHYGVVWTKKPNIMLPDGWTVYFGWLEGSEESVTEDYITNVNVSITNMEGCGNWLFAEHEFYDFEAWYYSDITELDTAKIAFSDGYHWVNATYIESTGTWRLYGDENVNNLAQITGEATDYNNGWYKIVFKIWLQGSILDEQNIELYMWSNNTNGDIDGWELKETDYFNIYSRGALIYEEGSGDYDVLANQSIWDKKAGNSSSSTGGWYYSEMLIRDLQSARWMTSIYLYGDDPFGERAIGEGLVEYGFKFCSPNSDNWTKALNVRINITDYDIGAGANRMDFKVQWFTGETNIINTEMVYGYFEQSDEFNGTRVIVDIWNDKMNNSEIGAGHVNPVYFDKANWLGGAVGGNYITQAYTPRTDFGFYGDQVSTQRIKLWKVYMNISCRNDDNNYYVTQQTQFNYMNENDEGVDHPTYQEPKKYEESGWGFFEPLRLALLQIASGFEILDKIRWGAIMAWFDTVWNWFLDNVPYVGAIFRAVAESFNTALEIFTWTIITIFTYIGVLFDVVLQVLTLFSGMIAFWIDWIELLVILHVLISLGRAVATGDPSHLWNMAMFYVGIGRAIWEVSNTVLGWITSLISAVGNYIPFT